MGCCDRYDSTASASRLPTLRFLAMSPSVPMGCATHGGTPHCRGLSGGAGRVVYGREPALGVRAPQVGEVLTGEHGRDLGDAAAVDADLAVPQLPGEHDAPAAGRVAAFGVLDPATAEPLQVPVVDDGAIGNQQLEHAVVEFDVDPDLAVFDVRGAQVQHGVPAVGADLELPGGGPVAEALGHLVVRGDPGRGGVNGVRGVHLSVPSWNRATTYAVVNTEYPRLISQCQLYGAHSLRVRREHGSAPGRGVMRYGSSRRCRASRPAGARDLVVQGLQRGDVDLGEGGKRLD